ncbi:hypothetical protein [Actinoplanes sp. NPDC026619]|uniref:hypothetical protein n=1 Tax=Actinoplanes sp. NPDC026619 TaxID=3155798 RepID=UPI0033CCA444
MPAFRPPNDGKPGKGFIPGNAGNAIIDGSSGRDPLSEPDGASRGTLRDRDPDPAVDGRDLRLPASPISRPVRTAASAPSDPPCADGGSPDDGRSPSRGDDPMTGPGEAGGSTGMSIVSVFPSASSFDPAVIAASVGTDASPTSMATMRT